MSAGDIGPAGLKDPISLFTYLVGAGGKVLTTSDDAHAILTSLGFSVDDHRKDLRMMSIVTESYDAIWWNRGNQQYSVEDLFRILQSLFKSLRPKKGILVFSFLKEHPDNAWPVRTVMTLLRQTGFQLFHSFESTDENLFFCQRI